MISQDQRKLLEDLSKTPYGQALRAYLYEKLAEIKNIENVESFEDVLGRKHAVKVVKDLFGFLEERKVVEPRNLDFT